MTSRLQTAEEARLRRLLDSALRVGERQALCAIAADQEARRARAAASHALHILRLLLVLRHPPVVEELLRAAEGTLARAVGDLVSVHSPRLWSGDQ